MRIDVVTIFPEFFDVLDVSLVGKAREKGILEFGVTNLRDFTHDVHHTVDDTPYGGGAGMVMKPEPWGEALDALLGDNTDDGDVVLIVPTPAGHLFTQKMARELSAASHLIFACGRYEGIDERAKKLLKTLALVKEFAVGEATLTGGEVPALAIIDAMSRRIPGVLGKDDSVEERRVASSAVYTRPDTILYKKKKHSLSSKSNFL